MQIYGKKELSMKDVIFIGLACAAIAAAGSASAASISKPVVLADLDDTKVQPVKVSNDMQASEALLEKAREDQRESLLKTQMRQLQQFRKQSEKEQQSKEDEAQESS